MATIAEVCDFAGISSVTFQALKKRGVIKAEKRGGYNVKKCVQSIIRDGQLARGGHGDHASSVALSNERAALAREQREAVALRNAISRGELIAVGDVKAEFSSRIAVCREHLLSIPGRIADALAMRKRAEIEGTLIDYISEALNELAHPAFWDSRRRSQS